MTTINHDGPWTLESMAATHCSECSASNGATPGCPACSVKRRYDRVMQAPDAPRGPEARAAVHALLVFGDSPTPEAER